MVYLLEMVDLSMAMLVIARGYIKMLIFGCPHFETNTYPSSNPQQRFQSWESWEKKGRHFQNAYQIYSNLVKPNWTFDLLPDTWKSIWIIGPSSLTLAKARTTWPNCVSCTKTPEASLVKSSPVRPRQTEPNSLWQGPPSCDLWNLPSGKLT